MPSNQRFSDALNIYDPETISPAVICGTLLHAIDECIEGNRAPERDYAVRLMAHHLAALFAVDGRGDPDAGFSLKDAISTIRDGQQSIIDYGRAVEDVLNDEALKGLVAQSASACSTHEFNVVSVAYTDARNHCQDLYSLELARQRAAGKLPRL